MVQPVPNILAIFCGNHHQSQVTSHGGGAIDGKFAAHALQVDSNGAVYLAGAYQGGPLSLAGGQTLASPGAPISDGFLGRVWLVRAPRHHIQSLLTCDYF